MRRKVKAPNFNEKLVRKFNTSESANTASRVQALANIDYETDHKQIYEPSGKQSQASYTQYTVKQSNLRKPQSRAETVKQASITNTEETYIVPKQKQQRSTKELSFAHLQATKAGLQQPVPSNRGMAIRSDKSCDSAANKIQTSNGTLENLGQQSNLDVQLKETTTKTIEVKTLSGLLPAN